MATPLAYTEFVRRGVVRAMGAGAGALLIHGGRNSGWYTHLSDRRGRWVTASRFWDESEPGDVTVAPAKAVAGAIVLGALFGLGGYAARELIPLPGPLAGAAYGAGCFVILEAANAALPSQRRLKRRVFREPTTALISLITGGAAVGWFSR